MLKEIATQVDLKSVPDLFFEGFLSWAHDIRVLIARRLEQWSVFVSPLPDDNMRSRYIPLYFHSASWLLGTNCL
jgi:hypothetical protein